MVTIEDTSDGERSIVTPELRLRFRRQDDRWTHAIDLRPGPWQTLAEAVEWTTAAEDPTRVLSPTYQELHLQDDGESVVALLVGQAGPHHFSASVRVSGHARDQVPPNDHGMTYRESRVEFDVADRCRALVKGLECHYVVHAPPVVTHLGDSRDSAEAEGFSRDWRSVVVWETDTENNHDVAVRGLGDPDAPALVALTDRTPSGGWHVRVAPASLTPAGTNRIRYAWSHTRVLKRAASGG